MPLAKHDSRKRAVIKPGRVVPASQGRQKTAKKPSALVQWGLQMATSRGSTYARHSQDLFPDVRSRDSFALDPDLQTVLGTVWPRAGSVVHQHPTPHFVHESSKLLRPRSKDNLLEKGQSQRSQNLAEQQAQPDGNSGPMDGSVDHLRYVRTGSPLPPRAVGELKDKHRLETEPLVEEPPTMETKPESNSNPVDAGGREQAKPKRSPKGRMQRFAEMRSESYLLNTMIALPEFSEDEKSKEIELLKAKLAAETAERKNRETQVTQLLELLDTLDSISDRIEGVNGILSKVRKRLKSTSQRCKRTCADPPTQTAIAEGTSEDVSGLHFRSERTLIPEPLEIASFEASQTEAQREASKEAQPEVNTLLSAEEDDGGFQSEEATPSAPSDEDSDSDLSPLPLTTQDSIGEQNPVEISAAMSLPAPQRRRRQGQRMIQAVTGATGTRALGRLTHGRSWKGRWGKVRESFDVWRDFQENCEASPSDSLDLLRTALLRHGCGMEKPKLQRLLNDVGMVAGSHWEYGDYMEVVRQAFAQRKKEHWIRSLKLHELVDTVIHDSLAREAVSPEGVFSINEKQAGTVFREVKRRVMKEVSNLNLQAERLTLNPHKSLDTPSCNSKFAMNTVTGSFGDLSQFFDGLDKHIGLPNPRIMKAMEMEHLYSEDSDDFFVTTNYNGTRTKPKTEWEFALNPLPDVAYPGVGEGEDGRLAAPLKRFLVHPYRFRAMLTDAEVLALRLYTGPMFMKYNTCLRKQPEELFEELKGNTYTTTVHAIVSGIIKLSKIWTLPEDRKLFRGLGGMLLPQVFWVPDEFGCRGGVELGLLSMTTSREIALQYSGKSDFRPTVFEIDVGQVDRGASVNWLSQYPMEEEVLMPPLSNLEVVGAPRMELVDGVEVMIVPLRVNVNIKSLTMDELIGRRMTLHMQMSRTIREETLQELREEMQAVRHKASMVGVCDRAVYERDVNDIVDDFDCLLEEHAQLPAEWYNDDEHYRSAITDIVGMKRLALTKWHLIQEHRSDKMSMREFDTSRALSGEALLIRIRETRCREFANEGVLYRLRSGYDGFPWEDIINRKLSEVELPSDMEPEQVILAWQCLAQIKEVLQKVYIQGAPYTKLFGTTLDLSNRRPPMQSRGISIVSGLMQVNTAVQQLKLNHCIVQDDGARTLAKGLLFIPDLVRLELSSADIGTPGMKSLCGTLTRMTNLQVLLLHDNNIGDAGATSVAKGLKGMTQLTQLDVSKNNLRLVGAQELAWSIGRLAKLPGLSLEHLNVSDNRIEEDGAIQVAQAVGALTSLQTLNLIKTFPFTMEVGKHLRDIVPATVKIYGIGEHALAEHELLTEHQLARNIRPGNRDDDGPKREGMFFQREQIWTLDSRRRKSSTTD